MFLQVIPDVFSILKANHLESQLIPPVVSVQQRLDDSKDVRRVSGSGGGNPLAAETSSALPQPLGPTQHHAVIALSLLGEQPSTECVQFGKKMREFLFCLIPNVGLRNQLRDHVYISVYGCNEK